MSRPGSKSDILCNDLVSLKTASRVLLASGWLYSTPVTQLTFSLGFAWTSIQHISIVNPVSAARVSFGNKQTKLYVMIFAGFLPFSF